MMSDPGVGSQKEGRLHEFGTDKWEGGGLKP